MAFDTARGVSVLFGGSVDSGPSEDTWALGVTCNDAPVASSPAGKTVCSAGSATFVVVAAGTGPFSYQWRKDHHVLADETDHLIGATAAILEVANSTSTDQGMYDCVVSNACGSVTTNGAALVICTSDYNCDGFVDSSDFFDFLAAFLPSPPAPAADFNHDASFNSQDFFDFMASFFTGCP
jgi:hypothetical protein